VRRQLGVHPRQIQNRIDLAHAMIGRNNVIEMERIERLAVIALLPPHHRKPPRSTWRRDGTIVRHEEQPTFATKSAHSVVLTRDHVR
jgi:hypothetical protein